jgi:lipid-binding SYLF domain-containing protein
MTVETKVPLCPLERAAGLAFSSVVLNFGFLLHPKTGAGPLPDQLNQSIQLILCAAISENNYAISLPLGLQSEDQQSWHCLKFVRNAQSCATPAQIY